MFHSVRGALSSLYDPSYNSGIIVSFFLGKYLNYIDQAKVQLLIPIIFILILFLLPESPEFWDKKNKQKVSHTFKKKNHHKNLILYQIVASNEIT